MCGIFGAVNTKGFFNKTDFELFQKLTDIVAHRGRDASGYLPVNSFTKDVDDQKFNIFLGHRRLSIIDLSADGHQPMKDGNTFISYNGEIFNYIELKEQLINKHIKFRTQSDSEVILKVYKEFGEEGFDQFNGMWAFILADLDNNRVVVSRDRFSMKPLFYTSIEGSIFFASEIKQLLPILKSKDVNEKAFFLFFKQGLIDIKEETFYKHIFKARPKHSIIIDLKGGITQKSYWDYSQEDIDENSIESRFRELITDSIRMRLRSDVEIGSLLSGGLDSSVISVIANDLLDGKLNTFSIIAENKKYSEENYIDIVASSNKIQNSKLCLNPSEILCNMQSVIYHQDEPFGSFSINASYAMFEKIKKETGIKVVLSGQGGDEALLGYLKFFFFYLYELKKNKKFIPILLELFYASFISRTVLFQSKFSLVRRYLPFFADKITDSYLKVRGEHEETWSFRDITERQKFDLDKYSVPALARYEDRNSMAFSIETRLPFLDHNLVNFLLNVKTSKKIKHGWSKYIMRKEISELPEGIRWRRDKRSFLIPEELWLKHELKEKIIHNFGNSMLEKLGIINSQKFLDCYKSYLKGNNNIHHSDISKVYIAEMWAKHNFD